MEKENKNLSFYDLELKQGEIPPPYEGLITHTPPPTDEKSQKGGWEEELMNLAAINYNLYFGSPAERADKLDEEGEKLKWSFDDATEELINFIRSLLSQERTKVREVIKGMKQKKPKDKCINAESNLFGRCFDCTKIDGYNDALTDLLSKLKEDEKI